MYRLVQSQLTSNINELLSNVRLNWYKDSSKMFPDRKNYAEEVLGQASTLSQLLVGNLKDTVAVYWDKSKNTFALERPQEGDYYKLGLVPAVSHEIPDRKCYLPTGNLQEYDSTRHYNPTYVLDIRQGLLIQSSSLYVMRYSLRLITLGADKVELDNIPTELDLETTIRLSRRDVHNPLKDKLHNEYRSFQH